MLKEIHIFFSTATPSSSFTGPTGPLAYLDHLLEEEVWLKSQTLWCNGTEMLTRGPSILSGTRGVRSAVSLAWSLMKTDEGSAGHKVSWRVGWLVWMNKKTQKEAWKTNKISFPVMNAHHLVFQFCATLAPCVTSAVSAAAVLNLHRANRKIRSSIRCEGASQLDWEHNTEDCIWVFFFSVLLCVPAYHSLASCVSFSGDCYLLCIFAWSAEQEKQRWFCVESSLFSSKLPFKAPT